MPGFSYDYRPSPLVGTIGDLILRGGDIRARAAEAIAAAQARAEEQRGQAWSGAIRDIGHTVAGIPLQMQEQRHRALQEEDIRAQIAERNAQAQARSGVAADSASLDRAFSPQSTLGPGVQGPLPENAPMPTRDQILANVPGHLREKVQQTFAEADRLAETSRKAKEQATKDAQEYMGFLGAQIRQAKYDPNIASIALQHAEESHADDPQALQGIRQMRSMFQQDPTSIQRVADAAILGSSYRTELKPERPIEHDPTKDLVTPTGDVILPGTPKEPTPKGYQHVDKLLDGKPATLLLDPTPGGKLYDLSGTPIENAASRVKPIPPAAQATIAQGKTDAQSIADAIESGQQPPTVQGLYRLAGPVRAELANRGYDMTSANLDWEATKKHLATLNGAQQTRLRQAISTASDSLGVIEDLAKQWDGGKFPLLNKANLALAKNGVLGPQAQQIATNLTAQITDVTSELGNVYMGGNSPTDHALSLAGKNLSADWTKDQLLSAIKLARTNLQIRGNSITNAGAVLSAPQPNTPPPAAGRDRVVGPNGETGTVPAGTPLPPGWKKQ